MPRPPGGTADSGVAVGTATIGLTFGNALAVPSLGRIANRPDLAISDSAAAGLRIGSPSSIAGGSTDAGSTQQDTITSTGVGGIVFAIEDALNVPVRFVGVGEKVGDLIPFDPDAFVSALFA